MPSARFFNASSSRSSFTTPCGKSSPWSLKRVSKNQFQCQLKLTRILCAGNRPKVRSKRRSIGNVEIRMIKNVICFGPEQEPRVLGYCKGFLQCDVELSHSRPDDGISRRISKRVQRG